MDASEEIKSNQSELYLSSHLEWKLDYKKEAQSNDNYDQKSKEERERSCIKSYLWGLLLYFTLFLIMIVLGILVGLYEIIRFNIIGRSLSQLQYVAWLVVSTSSILFTLLYFFSRSNEHAQSIHFLYQDSSYFIISTLLVATYLVVITKLEIGGSILNCDTDLNSILRTLSYQNKELEDRNAYFLDYNSYVSNIPKVQYEKNKEFPKLSSKFSCFQISGEPSLHIIEAHAFYKDFTQYLKPNFTHFLILAAIVLLKVVFVFAYIMIQEHLLTSDIVLIVIVLFAYEYITFVLNKLLSNNDLRRKTKQMEVFNDYINFRDVDKDNFRKKLDVTSSVSIETWDNARKFILSYKKEYLDDLELAYFCLIFYYVFVVMVCFSSYFELYWLISESSILQRPVVVIMSSFNFVFLTVFLLFRFAAGQQYNDTFEEIELSISYLQDAISDLDSMYKQFFYSKNKNLDNEERYSAYGVLIKRIKLLSKFYIESKQEYKNHLYTNSTKESIRREMIKDIKQNLKKVKQSLQTDKQELSYKFINYFDINIQDFLITLSIGLITTLPVIIPKFIKFYET